MTLLALLHALAARDIGISAGDGGRDPKVIPITPRRGDRGRILQGPALPQDQHQVDGPRQRPEFCVICVIIVIAQCFKPGNA
jgi:hypothetical protein